MPKDRLNELKQKTKQKDEVQNSNERPNGTSNNPNNELRRTFEQADEIGQWIEGIEKNNEEITLFIKGIEDIKFNQKDASDRLSSLFQNNATIARKVTNKLNEIDQEMIKISAKSAEGRIKSIQYNTLKQRFQDVLLENNKELKEWKAIQKATIQAQLTAKRIVRVNEDELTALLEEGRDIHVFTENILAQTEEAKRILANVEKRHQQLLKIERMLTEVHDLFVQMAILVDTQQETINRVEYQVQIATDYVGAVDLEKVRKSKKKHLTENLPDPTADRYYCDSSGIIFYSIFYNKWRMEDFMFEDTKT